MTAQSPTFSGGFWYSGYGDPSAALPYESGSYGTGGGTGTGDSSGQINSTGTVTVIFTWQPSYPGEPALPALISQTSDAYWFCNSPSPPAASCSNGLGDPEIDASYGQTYRGESRGTHYSVVAADSDGKITLVLQGAQAHLPQSVYSQSGYYSSNVTYHVDAYPISLTLPDPLGQPNLGDGKNQYVYDTTTPDGELDIETSVYVAGAPQDALNWMVFDPTTPMVDVNFLPGIPGQQPYQWTAAYGGLTPRSITPTKIIENGFSFLGLPPYVNGFGDHTATLSVYSGNHYNATQTAHIQTFFDGASSTSNWPGADGRPNWFYYYNQIYPYNQFSYRGTDYNLQPHAGTTMGYAPALSEMGKVAGAIAEDTTNPTSISLNPDAWSFGVVLGPDTLKSVDLPVFIVSSGKKIVDVGVMKLSGINAYERVCAHEQAHIKLWLGCKDETGLFAFPPFDNPMAPGSKYPWIDNQGNPIVDTDGDGIPDNVEEEYGLNPEESDSTGFFAENGRLGGTTTGDVECLCEIAALGEVVKHKGDCLIDWSSTGLQYGAHPVYPNVPAGTYYPYKFQPSDIAYPLPSIDPPSAALESWDQIISDIASK